jgi:hypothetical protein
MSLHPLQAQTSQRPPALAVLVSTLTHRATKFGCMRLPFVEEPPAAPPAARDRHAREQITSTGIVILGLLEIVFAGFLVGSTQQGSLHPVWKVIMGLAVIGIAASAVRLRRLVQGRAGTATTLGADPHWPGVGSTQSEAGASTMPSWAKPA